MSRHISKCCKIGLSLQATRLAESIKYLPDLKHKDKWKDLHCHRQVVRIVLEAYGHLPASERSETTQVPKSILQPQSSGLAVKTVFSMSSSKANHAGGNCAVFSFRSSPSFRTCHEWKSAMKIKWLFVVLPWSVQSQEQSPPRDISQCGLPLLWIRLILLPLV